MKVFIKLLLSFLPWILFYLLPLHTVAQLKVAITALLLLSIITGYRDLKRGFILPWCTLLFFTFIFFGIVVFDLKILAVYMSILVNSVLATLALGSLAVGKPFTLQYARLEVAKDKWQNPVFIFVNQVLTFVWGMSFLFNLILNILRNVYPYPHSILATLSNASTLGAIFFTVWFPKWYQKRIQKKHQHQ